MGPCQQLELGRAKSKARGSSRAHTPRAGARKAGARRSLFCQSGPSVRPLLVPVTMYKGSIEGRQIKGHTGGAQRVHRRGEKFNKFGREPPLLPMLFMHMHIQSANAYCLHTYTQNLLGLGSKFTFYVHIVEVKSSTSLGGRPLSLPVSCCSCTCKVQMHIVHTQNLSGLGTFYVLSTTPLLPWLCCKVVPRDRLILGA